MVRKVKENVLFLSKENFREENGDIVLTHNSIHDNQCNIMLHVKFIFIAFLIQVFNTLSNAFVKDWNKAVEDGETEG